MLGDALYAVLRGGIPMLVLSFGMVSWAIYRGWLSGDSVSEMQESIAALGEHQKDRKRRRRMNPVMDKWFQFGGGFYGLVAFYTWLLLEWPDVKTFISSMSELLFSFEAGAVFHVVLQLFIDSLINFGLAIAWPAYWLQDNRGPWELLFVAYGGYWLGIRTAQYAWQQGWTKSAAEGLQARWKSLIATTDRE
ncbi:hypothetical protein BST95_01430 [Halioglobus japonicus]|nr:hypothetical protein [Halioglobus japonicus]AQA17073.1 hypothetical protein BST95_01430 [Halioglobus japonicus]